MTVRSKAMKLFSVCALLLLLVPMIATAQGKTARITGVVRDDANAIALPGVPVEVVGTTDVVYTDVDGRYVLQVPPGKHQLKVVLDGYQERLINVDVVDTRPVAADIGLTMRSLTETVIVQAEAVDLETSSAEAKPARKAAKKAVKKVAAKKTAAKKAARKPAKEVESAPAQAVLPLDVAPTSAPKAKKAARKKAPAVEASFALAEPPAPRPAPVVESQP